MRIKGERSGEGEEERAAELGMKIAGQTPTFVALVQYGIVRRSTRRRH